MLIQAAGRAFEVAGATRVGDAPAARGRRAVALDFPDADAAEAGYLAAAAAVRGIATISWTVREHRVTITWLEAKQ